MLFGILDAQSYTVDEIKNEYKHIFSTEIRQYKNKSYVVVDVNKLQDDHFLADFVNNHHLYIDYILKNYNTFDWKTLYDYTADTIRLHNYLIETLQADSVFNKYFLEATHFYLTSVSQKITDHQVQKKLNITADSLVTIATRFFYATRFTNNGDAQWYVCVGKNGYRFDKKDNMIPLIEAFCFMTVMNDLKTDEYKVFSNFKKNIKKLKKQKTDKEGNEKLDYYRQTMYQMMGRSDRLRTLLLEKYNKKKDILNFELTEK